MMLTKDQERVAIDATFSISIKGRYEQPYQVCEAASREIAKVLGITLEEADICLERLRKEKKIELRSSLQSSDMGENGEVQTGVQYWYFERPNDTHTQN